MKVTELNDEYQLFLKNPKKAGVDKLLSQIIPLAEYISDERFEKYRVFLKGACCKKFSLNAESLLSSFNLATQWPILNSNGNTLLLRLFFGVFVGMVRPQ